MHWGNIVSAAGCRKRYLAVARRAIATREWS